MEVSPRRLQHEGSGIERQEALGFPLGEGVEVGGTYLVIEIMIDNG